MVKFMAASPDHGCVETDGDVSKRERVHLSVCTLKIHNLKIHNNKEKRDERNTRMTGKSRGGKVHTRKHTHAHTYTHTNTHKVSAVTQDNRTIKHIAKLLLFNGPYHACTPAGITRDVLARLCVCGGGGREG
jgi:hypothetical protein